MTSPILYLEIIVIHGNIDIMLTRVAPIPRVTNNTGKAQQIRVLKLVNKLKIGVMISL